MKNIQKTARFAGILYFIITVAAIIAHMYMPSEIIVAGDANATVNNITNSNSFGSTPTKNMHFCQRGQSSQR